MDRVGFGPAAAPCWPKAARTASRAARALALADPAGEPGLAFDVRAEFLRHDPTYRARHGAARPRGSRGPDGGAHHRNALERLAAVGLR